MQDKIMGKALMTALAIIMGATQLFGQISVNRSDLQLQAGDTIQEQVVFTPSIDVPSEGANQNWDYSNLFSGGVNVQQNTRIRRDASGRSGIQSDFYENESAGLGGVAIPARLFYAAGSSAYAIVGQQVTDGSSINLDNGSIRVDTSINANRGGQDRLAVFPLQSGDQWQDRYRSRVFFDVSVFILNINGYGEGIVSVSSEVVGWGQLKLPGDTAADDALLLRRIRSRVDSIYNQNGAPISSTVLENANLEQGQRTVDTTYYFYRKSGQGPAATLSIRNNGVFAFRTEDRGINTGRPPLPADASVLKRLYPQPADGFLFAEGRFSEPVDIRLWDGAGKRHRVRYHQQAGRIRIQTGELAAGVYFLEIDRGHAAGAEHHRVLIR